MNYYSEWKHLSFYSVENSNEKWCNYGIDFCKFPVPSTLKNIPRQPQFRQLQLRKTFFALAHTIVKWNKLETLETRNKTFSRPN